MHPLDRIARNTDLQDAVPKLSQADRVGSSSENEELRKKLEVLVNSNDPLAHELLVKSAKQAVMRDARDLSEGALGHGGWVLSALQSRCANGSAP
jgi:hypothetical protein